ncbi:uncharacterized protein HD556DRAFT_1209166, partial [Suillus plorans]
LLASISKVTDDPIKLFYDTISLPETQFVAQKLLVNNNILVLTPRALVKEAEGEGRKVVPAFGDRPHVPQNEGLCRSSWVMVEKWL